VLAKHSVKSSLGKHESDIPTIELGDILPNFIARHRQMLDDAVPLDTHVQLDTVKDANSVHCRLKHIKHEMSHLGLTTTSLKYLFSLEKKFVLHGKLYCHYSEDFKLGSGSTTQPDIYIYLAYLLFNVCEVKDDLNALNSAIRLLDESGELIRQGYTLSDVELLEKSLSLEESLLKGLSIDK
jgi:hypothetical protein